MTGKRTSRLTFPSMTLRARLAYLGEDAPHSHWLKSERRPASRNTGPCVAVRTVDGIEFVRLPGASKRAGGKVQPRD